MATFIPDSRVHKVRENDPLYKKDIFPQCLNIFSKAYNTFSFFLDFKSEAHGQKNNLQLSNNNLFV